MDQPTDNLFGEFFAPGVDATDVPALFTLLRAKDTLSAFITLFRGGEDEVLVRLLVLQELSQRATQPRWSRPELDQHFAYLDPVKLETVLKRLRENGLLTYGDDGLYQLSTAGRNAMAAVAVLLQFSSEQDAELGYITAMVAGSQAVGKVSPAALQHLLHSLTALHELFEQAIVSGSEFRIREAKAKLDSVWRWVQKGTEVMRAITADAELDSGTHALAQAIGLAQSKMARTDAAFQRTLNRLEQQRVHLGQSGLSSSDIAQFLRRQSRDALGVLLSDGLLPPPRAQFVAGPHDLLDIAEYELLERVRLKEAQSVLPPPCPAPESDAVEGERLIALEHFLGKLSTLIDTSPLADVVVGGDYSLAAYRLSLLALLDDPESSGLNGPVADLARLPLQVSVSDTIAKVQHDGVEEMSEGVVTKNAN